MSSMVARLPHDAARALILLDLVVLEALSQPFAAWASRRGLSGELLGRVARALREVGVVGMTVEGRFEFTDHARKQFDPQTPGSDAAMARHEWQQQDLWVNVDRSLRGLALELQQDHTLPRVPGRLATLLAAMSNADMELRSALAALPWPESGQLWDIAGGDGRIAYGIAASNPGLGLEARVVDHPVARTYAENVAAELGVSDGFVGMDILEALRTPLQGMKRDRAIFLFSRCLHNFSPSIQDDLLRYAWEQSSMPVRFAVVNPFWDWNGSGGVVNPEVAMFGFYMAVNAYGGGVPSRGDIQSRLAQIGEVAQSRISETLDLFVVGDGGHEDWVVGDDELQTPLMERDLELEFDRFVHLALCNAAMEWKLPEMLISPRGVSEIEKHLGLPRSVVSSVLAGLVAIDLCSRDDGGLFRWVTPINASDRELVARFVDCWRGVADDSPSAMSSTSVRSLANFLC